MVFLLTTILFFSLCAVFSHLFNSRRVVLLYFRWLFFLLPAFVLASIAVGIYTGLETTANYKYLHSVWHIAIASCIPLLLPTSRKPKFYADYCQVNVDDDFRDSDESLSLNVRNTAGNQESRENPEFDRVPFPQLIT